MPLNDPQPASGEPSKSKDSNGKFKKSTQPEVKITPPPQTGPQMSFQTPKNSTQGTGSSQEIPPTMNKHESKEE
jgi:hypothetical protein